MGHSSVMIAYGRRCSRPASPAATVCAQPRKGACAYTNICEHCPNFRSEKSFLPILATRRIDAEALAADAERFGWGEEAARHRALVQRLDLLISRAQAG